MKKGPRKVRREQEWKSLGTPAMLNRDHDVIVRLGDTVITRKEMIEEIGSDLMRSGRTLTREFAKHQPKNARDLAKRVSMNQMFDTKNVGLMAVTLFGLVLIHIGVDPNKWADGKLKLSTRYAKAKAVARKRVRKYRTRKDNVVRFAANR